MGRQTVQIDGPTRNVDGDEESGDARAYAGDVFGFRLWVLSSSEDIYIWSTVESKNTEIGKKAWLFAKLQPGRARKKINAT